MRTLIRLAVLTLAAFGAKALYERLAPRKEALRSSGTRLVDRSNTAIREMGGAITGARQTVGAAVQEGAAELKAAASEQLQHVTAAAGDVKHEVAEGLKQHPDAETSARRTSTP